MSPPIMGVDPLGGRRRLTFEPITHRTAPPTNTAINLLTDRVIRSDYRPLAWEYALMLSGLGITVHQAEAPPNYLDVQFPHE